MHYAAFVRSPHAHAKINGIDKSAAEGMSGVAAVFDGKQLTGDGIGNIICGWMVHSKDGSPMNMGAWSAWATGYVRSGRRGLRRDCRDAGRGESRS